jgi:tetratricopeptide (TPR) repeat protein
MSDAIAAHIENATQARKDNRLQDAKSNWLQALVLCRCSTNRLALIQSLKGLAQIERDLGHDADSLPLYEEAVALARAEGDPLLLAHTVRHLGDIHRQAAQFPQAQNCYEEALTLYRSNATTAPLDLANALRPYALLKEQIGEREHAKPLWEEARKLYASANAPDGVSESAKHLSDLGA